jgi:hypothetical protein
MVPVGTGPVCTAVISCIMCWTFPGHFADLEYLASCEELFPSLIVPSNVVALPCINFTGGLQWGMCPDV